MSAENIKVFQGGTFVFEVAGGRFEVYRALVARKSRALDAMMENGMAASRAGVAPLEDTDASTFARFAEFLISGDYNAAVPAELSLADDSDNKSDEEECDDLVEDEDVADRAESPPPMEDAASPPVTTKEEDFDCGRSNQKKYSKKAKKKLSFWDPVEEPLFKPPPPPSLNSLPFKSVDLSGPTSDVEVAPTMRTNSMFVPDGNWQLDYLPVFLSHAQVYVFADRYGIRDLQKLAARRLDEALGLFQFTSPCNTEFSKLLEYVYSHTATRKTQTDVLRTIVVNFAARNMRALVDSKQFLKMVKGGGDVVRDVIVKAVSRLQN